MKRKLWLAVLVVLFLLPMATPVLADDGENGGRVVFGQDFLLEQGEVVDGDLAVLGGSATLEAGSRVDGDLVVLGGSVTAQGDVTGDVVVIGGNVHLGSTASVDGDLMILGGNVSGTMEAVGGRISEGFSFPIRRTISVPRSPRPLGGWSVTGNPVLSWFLRGLRAVGTGLVLALIALLVVTLWPRQADLVAKTVWHSPAASFGIGFLTYLVVVGLTVLLAITICLSPLALLLVLVTAVAFLFGWMALGWLVGRRILAALKANDAAVIWQAALGVFLITVLGATPCLGWLVWVAGGAFGLGAAVLTRFGTRRYNGSGSGASVEPPSSGLDLPRPARMEEADSTAGDTDSRDDVDGLEALVESPALEFDQPLSSVDETREDGSDDAPSPHVEAVSESPFSVVENVVDADEGLLTGEDQDLDSGSEAVSDLGLTDEGDTVDDLELITGIGPVFAARLRTHGITTFAQLAAAEPEKLAEIVELFPERVVEDDWIGQAKERMS